MVKGICISVISNDKLLYEKIAAIVKTLENTMAPFHDFEIELLLNAHIETGDTSNDETVWIYLFLLDMEYDKDPWSSIGQARQALPYTRTILINGPHDFNTLYDCMNRGIDGYFTVPLDTARLEAVLLQIFKDSEELNRVQVDRERLNAIDYVKHLQKTDKIMKNLLRNPERLELMLDEVNRRYQTNLKDDYFLGIVISIDRPELYAGRYGFGNECLMLVDGMFRNPEREIIVAKDNPYGFIGIINSDQEISWDELKDKFENLAVRIRRLSRKYDAFNVSIGVGPFVYGLCNIRNSLDIAYDLVTYKIKYPDQDVFSYADYRNELEGSTESYELPIMLEKNFRKYIKRYDVANLLHLFDELEPRFNKKFKDNPPLFRKVIRYMLDIIDSLYDQDPEKEEWLKNKPDEALFYVFNFSVTLKKFRMALIETCNSLSARNLHSRSNAIMRAIDYLNTHYAQGITLEELASVCNWSPNYMSNKFKEEMGESYMDYLIDIRLRRAKELLLSTDMTVKAISESIGYIDEKYFSKLFKKYYEKTPSEYRNKKRPV